MALFYFVFLSFEHKMDLKQLQGIYLSLYKVTDKFFSVVLRNDSVFNYQFLNSEWYNRCDQIHVAIIILQ